MEKSYRNFHHNAVVITVLLCLVTAGVGFFLHRNRMDKERDYHARHLDELVTIYEAAIQMYRLAMDGFYANTICRPEVAGLFAEGAAATGDQRNLARGRLYRRLYHAYRSMREYRLLQLQFHLPDGTSFLRFQRPERYGDDLLEVRHSVRMVNTAHHSVYGFELGKVRSGFRYVYPVSWQGRHVGSVEVSVTTRAIQDAMNALAPGREYQFLLNRMLAEPHIFSEDKPLYHPSTINPGFIIEDDDARVPNASLPLSPDAEQVSRQLKNDPAVQAAMRIGNATTVRAIADSHPYTVSLMPVRDIIGQLAGYLVTYAPDAVTGTYFKEFVIYMTTALASLCLIALLLFSLQQRSAALAREKQNLSVMNDALAEGVCVMDPAGRIRRINPAGCRMLGRPGAELVGRTALDLFLSPGDDAVPEENRSFFSLLCQGMPYDGEIAFFDGNRNPFIAKVASRPLFSEGRLAGSVTAFHDITERKRTEEALKRSEEMGRKLSAAVEQSPASVVITDTRGTIEYVNPKFEEKTGYTFAEAVGQNPRILNSGKMPNDVYRELWESISAGREWKGELHNRRKNGTFYWEFAAISPIRNTRGEITHYVAVKEDITQRKQMEETLKDANRKLKEAIIRAEELAEKADAANQAKSSFLANMSHEIRTPLNAILGYSQLLQQDATLTDKHRRQVRTINRSGDHLLELINNILEMSKIEAGRIDIKREKMHFPELMRDIHAIFNLACQKKGLYLEIITDGFMPDRLWADRGKVRQVLINLISNSIKFTERGGLALRSTARRLDGGGWMIQMDVADTGSGIDPKEQAALFRAFEQTASGRSAGEGTGLGLSISRAYAQAMGGDLYLVESEAGRGTRFRFILPAEAVTDSEKPHQQSLRPVGENGMRPHPAPHRSHVPILVVEDDPGSRELLTRLLRDLGYPVRSVESGEMALEAFARQAARIVLLDLQLPGIDGFETGRRIRALPGGEAAGLMAVTAGGVSAGEIRRHAAVSGIDAVVVKPYKTDEMIRKIDMLVSGEGLDANGTGPEPDDAARHRQAVRGLPAALQDTLRSRVEMGDMAGFHDVVRQVVSIDPDLAVCLRELAHQFEYDTLLTLLSGAGPAPAKRRNGNG